MSAPLDHSAGAWTGWAAVLTVCAVLGGCSPPPLPYPLSPAEHTAALIRSFEASGHRIAIRGRVYSPEESVRLLHERWSTHHDADDYPKDFVNRAISVDDGGHPFIVVLGPDARVPARVWFLTQLSMNVGRW